MSDLSRVEQLLRNALGEDIYNITPQSRVEELLAQLNELIEGISASVDPEELTPIVTAWLADNIHDGAVVDTSLSVAGAAADSKKTGDEISQLKEDFNAVMEVESNVVAQDTISETLSANTDKAVRLPHEYLKGRAYEITVTLNEVHWKSNGTQFVRIGAYSANSVSSSYLVEFIRLDTDTVSKETLTIRYVPSTDTVKMIGFVFYLGSGSQDIDVTISEINSEIANSVNSLKNISQYVLPLVDVSEKQFDGSTTSATSVLYFPYNFYAGNKYKLSFECVIGTETVTNCLRVHTATVQSVSDNYKKDIINAGASASPLCGTINDFSTGNIIEEEFTANNDASCLIVVYYGSLNSNYQINVTIARVSSVESLDKEVLSKNVVSLNRDVEPYILQLGREISPQTQNHNYKRLNFIFFSDIHARADLWKRICDYMDEYSDIIPFAIHGGDYVSTDLGESSVVDLYGIRKPNSGAILNTVGNHDCYPSGQTSPTAPIADTHNVLYSSVDTANDGWDCVFGNEQYAMYWYKDITDAQIRIICIDQYHWTEEQAAFITNAFADANTNNYATVTVTHTPITTAVDNIGSGFWTLDNWALNDTYSGSMIDIRATIATFINNGGTHLVNLCGHIHSDQIGTLSSDGIFQIRTQTASDNGLWTDTVRAVGTKTYDCFNVIQIDRNLGMIKLVRVGNNTSDCLQARTTLCFDYVNKRLISNN